MSLFRNMRKRLELQWQTRREGRVFVRRLLRYGASFGTEKDAAKLQYTLLRTAHTLEKGLSMPSPRKGFGKEKALGLIEGLGRYASLYGSSDPEFLTAPMQTLAAYLDYSEKEGTDVSAVKAAFEGLLETYCGLTGRSSLPEGTAGTLTADAGEIRAAAKGDFGSLLRSRHSIRSFAREEVPDATILKALELAQRTPSACNRQAWKTHVFKGDESVRLIRWQGGCKGFEEEIRTAILVTADMRAFLSYEPHQAYVDGGLYAMNLINALHYLGLGTIPVSTGFKCRHLDKLYSGFGIPENEVPIVIIGTGPLPEEVRFAASQRKSTDATNTFHR